MIFAGFEASEFPKNTKVLQIILDFWEFSKNPLISQTSADNWIKSLELTIKN